MTLAGLLGCVVCPLLVALGTLRRILQAIDHINGGRS